jgi:hypothetical protein
MTANDKNKKCCYRMKPPLTGALKQQLLYGCIKSNFLNGTKKNYNCSYKMNHMTLAQIVKLSTGQQHRDTSEASTAAAGRRYPFFENFKKQY